MKIDDNLLWEAMREKSLSEGYASWLPKCIPQPLPMAVFQKQIWDWIELPKPVAQYKKSHDFQFSTETHKLIKQYLTCIAIVHRGGAKSTTAEAIWCYLSALKKTRYAVYVSDTQKQAESHVQNIRSMIETDDMVRLFPELSDSKKTLKGQQENYTKSIITTFNDCTVQAVGLDSNIRGLKKGNARPDLIIIDDIDRSDDTTATTRKKLDTLNRAVLPAGTENTRVLYIQNLIKKDGVIATKWAELEEATRIGMIPAVYDLKLDGTRIIGGRSAWKARGLNAWQTEIDKVGLHAFMQEYQHEITDNTNSLFKQENFRYCEKPDSFDQIYIGVDPAVSTNETSDLTGIIVVGILGDIIYVLEDRSGKYTPEQMGATIKTLYDMYRARVVVETNQGGHLLKTALQLYDRTIPIIEQKATINKSARAEPLSILYEQHRVFHTQHFPELEYEMTTYHRGDKKSPDRLDGLVWACHPYTSKPKKQTAVGFVNW